MMRSQSTLERWKLRLRDHRLLHRVYFALLQLVFRILDLCDR